MRCILMLCTRRSACSALRFRALRCLCSRRVVALPQVLVVDDNAAIRPSMCKILERHGFAATGAGDVTEALKYISHTPFDVLLSDLHMPGAEDGLRVVSAMRHANPTAVTLVLSASPELSASSNAILLQADQILIKPMPVPDLIKAIQQRLETRSPA